MTDAEKLVALLNETLDANPDFVNEFTFSDLGKPGHFLFQMPTPTGNHILLIKDPKFICIQVFEGDSIVPSDMDAHTKGLAELLEKLIARHPKTFPY